MLISPAYAQGAPGGAMEGLQAFLPLILIFVIFYFLLIRPQQRKMKEHKAMLAAVRRGDRIVTGGGMIGTVVKVVNDTELSVEVADNIRVRVMRDMVASVLSKSEPAESDKPANDSGAAEGKPESGGASSKLKSLLGGKKG